MSTEVGNDELLEAIERGDVQTVDQALQTGVSPNFVIDYDESWITRSNSLLSLAAKVRMLKWNVSLAILLIHFYRCIIVGPNRRGCSVDCSRCRY